MNGKLFIKWSRHRFTKNGPDQGPSTKEIWDSMSPEESLRWQASTFG